MARLPALALLRRAARQQRRLERLAAGLEASDHASILGLGSAVLLHGLFEETHLLQANRLLDPSVRAQLAREHSELGDGLALLEELLARPAAREDLDTLASALVERLREHIERDSRVLYQPLERLGLQPV